nr:transmembrane and TPR repeat-containing protein 1-like isoform X1 [Salvelinus alpinus]
MKAQAYEGVSGETEFCSVCFFESFPLPAITQPFYSTTEQEGTLGRYHGRQAWCVCFVSGRAIQLTEARAFQLNPLAVLFRERTISAGMGYCILVAHGLGRLCSVVGRWGTTALTVSTLLLLLLFSWKTVQQNDIWLSREALFRSGIQTLPHNAKVHYNYANFLKDRGRHQEAIHHYKTALRLYPRHASAMNNLGTLTRHPEDAEHYYRTALDTNPQHNRALFNLGNLLKSQGKMEEAEALLRDSIRFGPHFADAYSSLASLYAEQKRFAEANDVYLQGIESCPDSSDLHNNYGVFLVDTGEGALAAAHYQHAVRLKPAHYVAMVNLGRLLRSSSENKEAESWYKKALQVTRKVDILTPLGALYYNTGRYEEALQVYREAATLQPDSTDIWLALAQVLAMAGRSKEAEKMTLGIISKQGSCIECYRLLSAIYSKRGNNTEALDALDKALLQNPLDMSVRAELHFSKGNQLREMNQLDRAFESYKLVVELKPDQSQAWMNMGGIQHIKGDYAAARQYYQRALILTPGSKLLKENLAKLDRLERRLTGA